MLIVVVNFCESIPENCLRSATLLDKQGGSKATGLSALCLLATKQMEYEKPVLVIGCILQPAHSH
jgi:hypothetical protein